MGMQPTYPTGRIDWPWKLASLIQLRKDFPNDRFALDVRGGLDLAGWTGELIKAAREGDIRLSRHLAYNAAFGAELGQLPETLVFERETILEATSRFGPDVFGHISMHPFAFQAEDTLSQEGAARFALMRPPSFIRACIEQFPRTIGRQFRRFVRRPIFFESVHGYLYDLITDTPPVFYAGQMGWLGDLLYWRDCHGFLCLEDTAHGYESDILFHRGKGFAGLSQEYDWLPRPDLPETEWTEDQKWLVEHTGLLFVEGFAPVAVGSWQRLSKRLEILRVAGIHLDMTDHTEDVVDGVHLAASHLQPNLGIEWHKQWMIEVVSFAERNDAFVLAEPESMGPGWSLAGRSETSEEAHRLSMDAIIETWHNVRSGQWRPAV